MGSPPCLLAVCTREKRMLWVFSPSPDKDKGTSYIVPVKRENEKMLSFVKTIS
jgi:hypothetical protein